MIIFQLRHGPFISNRLQNWSQIDAAELIPHPNIFLKNYLKIAEILSSELLTNILPYFK